MAGDSGDNVTEVEEGDIPHEWLYLNSLIEVTPESALVSSLLNRPAGSGSIMYADTLSSPPRSGIPGLLDSNRPTRPTECHG
jgi:hypothetical protein